MQATNDDDLEARGEADQTKGNLKQAGEKIEAPKEREPSNVVNLMEALRRSIDADGGVKRKQPVRSTQRRKRGKKTASKSHARQPRAS